MLKVLSVDPSGTGTTGICLIWGIKKVFFEFKNKIWQEHYQYILNLVKQEKPHLVLIETAYYEKRKGGTKDLMDLEKLVGALECLKFHTKSEIVMRQNKLTKDLGEKLKSEAKTIPNLFYHKKKWFYYEEETEIERRTKEKTRWMNQTNGWQSSGEGEGKTQIRGIQELSQHQTDALIIWHLYSKSYPYLGEGSRISRNSRYC